MIAPTKFEILEKKFIPYVSEETQKPSKVMIHYDFFLTMM